jgi:Protein of unknown function (DUF2752)
VIARAGRPSVHAVCLAGVAVLLLGAAAILPLDAAPLSLFPCPFRGATGWPCPGCGCTHAFHFAVRGELGLAISHSPLGTVLAVACAAHVVWTALRLSGLPYAPALELTRRARWAAVSALAANWLFVAVWGAR